jgi:hypothetical protein
MFITRILYFTVIFVVSYIYFIHISYCYTVSRFVFIFHTIFLVVIFSPIACIYLILTYRFSCF